MGPTRVNRKLPDECFESGEEQIKGYGKVTQNTEIFSTKYGNNISEVGSPVVMLRGISLKYTVYILIVISLSFVSKEKIQLANSQFEFK